jgi:hypothetical protein
MLGCQELRRIHTVWREEEDEDGGATRDNLDEPLISTIPYVQEIERTSTSLPF